MTDAVRVVVTVFHVLTALAALGSLLTGVVEWAADASTFTCQPPAIYNRDSLTECDIFKDVLTNTCEANTYGSGAVCLVSITLAIILNCCWRRWSFSVLSQMLCLLICVGTLGCVAATTASFWMWCQALQDSEPGSTGCKDATGKYDEHKPDNETSAGIYFRKMELQQSCQWAVAAFAMLTVILHTVVIKRHSSSANRTRGHYYNVPEEESAPLLSAKTLSSAV